MTANPPDRRASCMLCGLRCDPDRWTCTRCHGRLIRLAQEALLDDIKPAAQDVKP